MVHGLSLYMPTSKYCKQRDSGLRKAWTSNVWLQLLVDSLEHLPNFALGRRCREAAPNFLCPNLFAVNERLGGDLASLTGTLVHRDV